MSWNVMPRPQQGGTNYSTLPRFRTLFSQSHLSSNEFIVHKREKERLERHFATTRLDSLAPRRRLLFFSPPAASSTVCGCRASP